MCDNIGCVYVQEYKEDHDPKSRSVFNTGDDERRTQLVVDGFVSGRCVQHTDKFVHNVLSYRWLTEKFFNFFKTLVLFYFTSRVFSFTLSVFMCHINREYLPEPLFPP